MDNLLLARFSGVPSFVAPSMQGRFETALRAVVSHARAGEILAASALADDGFWPSADDWRSFYRPYVVREGVLHIPVKGVLLHDFPWALGSWATGYIYIARAIERGVSDPNVRAIALICDSFGGEVAGCFELVDKIYAARGQKPIRAFAHEYAFSAGYAVASAADHIAMSRTGGVGSIGVVSAHVDVSEAMADAGVKITFIYAGKHKVDGNAYEKLPESVKARWQSMIDDAYGVFTATVARNRDMDEGAVRATEAECFTAKEAVENGLADTIAPLDDAVAEFVADLSKADETGDEEMNDKTSASATGATNEQLAAARSEGHAAGTAEGTKAGATAERARISAILGSDEAKGRQKQASHIAFATDMSADAAKAMLGASAQEQAEPAAAADPLAAAMGGVKNPKVGADAEKTETGDLDAVSASVKGYLGAGRAA